MKYDIWRFTSFRPNDGWYGHFHGIVYLNDLILCTSVHLGVAKNVAEESFYFRCTKKSFFISRVQKMGFFVKDMRNICCKIGWKHLKQIWDHMLCTNNQILRCIKFPSTSHEKGKILPIQLKTGQIWTTSAS